jgi:hypothetical protein
MDMKKYTKLKLGISPGCRPLWIHRHKGEDTRRIEINVERIEC